MLRPGPVCLVIAGCIALVVWLLSLITREYSWVDRIWSLAPIAYVWIFAGAAHFDDPRLDLVAVLVTMWGVRLTFNFARKGGYAPGGEDYRWAVLRERLAPWQFQGFNLAFIAIYQNVIILLMTLPVWSMYEHQGRFGAADVVIAVLFVLTLCGETIADEQQWRFQRRKKAAIAAGREPSTRFVQTGLFRFSRHPNFFCEVTQWWLVFAFAVVAARTVLMPTVAGPVLLTVLFAGSTRFTESISLTRYPEYAEYQRRTAAFVPCRPGREADRLRDPRIPFGGVGPRP